MEMHLEIIPYTGVGPLRFGMTRDKVQEAMGKEPTRFMRTSTSVSETDAFEAEGIYVSYDENEECEAVEMASPADPVLMGKNLVGAPYSGLRDWFLKNDSETQTDESGLISYGLGVGLFAPSALKSPLDPIESVIVFRRGYYD